MARPDGWTSFAERSSKAEVLIAPHETTTTSAEYSSRRPPRRTTTVLTSRPGRVKAIVDIPLEARRDGDIRSAPEFAELRHRVWGLLHEEVQRAERLEIEDSLGRPSTAATA